jgi:hypothetical protein
VLETLGIIGFGPSMSVVLFQSQSLQPSAKIKPTTVICR